MPLKVIHLNFDIYLMIKGVIEWTSDCKEVHKRLDSGNENKGAFHRIIDPFHWFDDYDPFIR